MKPVQSATPYILIASFTLAVLASACQPIEPTPPSDTATPVTPTEEPTVLPTPTTEVIPTAQVLPLSDQPYLSPSDSFSIIFPLGWTCQETDLYQIDCSSSSEDAHISVRAIATGYELLQEHFEAMVGAEMVHAYRAKRTYMEQSYGVAEGQISIDADWRDEGVDWFSRDAFTRQGAGVLHISLRALQERRDTYLPVFDQVVQSAEFQAGALSGAPLYQYRQPFTARDGLFSIEVPTSWSKYSAPINVGDTIVEGLLAPDLRAQVQVAVYRRDSLLEQADRIAITQDLMRALYGSDVRYASYKALPDGRERGEWYAERRGVSGISFNGTYRNYLYLFSVVWDAAGYDLYWPVLEEVMDSFSR